MAVSRAADALPKVLVVVDCDGALLVGANAEARRKLGFGKPIRTPVPLDAAMPALQTLRLMAATSTLAGLADLTFWAPNGVLRWQCRYARTSRRAARFTLEMLPAAASGEAGTLPTPQPTPVTLQSIARLAHELRAPVSAIFSAADVMAEGHLGAVEDERYHGYIVGIRDTARHLLGVVETMLRNPESAIENDQNGPTEINVGVVVGEVAHGLNALADTAGVILTVDLAQGALVILAERTGLRQMIYNLLSNALRHAGPGALVTARTGRTPAGEIWLEVEDDGPGIPDTVVIRTMQTEAPSDSGTGAGLGLPLTRKLAEAAGASLSLNSDTSGTRARVTFPKTACQKMSAPKVGGKRRTAN